MEQDKELENLIAQLDKKESYPSLEFEFRLRDRLLNSNQSEFKGFFAKLFFGLGKIKLFNYSKAALLSSLTFLFVGVYYYYLNNQYTLHEQVRTLKGNEQYGLLTQVYSNNPQAILSYNKPLLTNNIADAITSDSVSLLINTPASDIPKNYNYFHFTSQVAYSSFASNCIGMNTDNTFIELYSYEGDMQGKDIPRYLKSIEYKSDNSILDYQLVRDNEYFRFFNGTTTHLTTLPQTDNSPYFDNELNSSIGLFNQNVEVVEIVSGDRILYKVIKSEPNNFCYFTDEDAQNNIQTKPGNIITILLIDPAKEFAVIEAQYYYDFPSLSNQILIVKNNQERAYLQPTEAELLFRYDLDLPVEVMPEEIQLREDQVSLLLE